jgi:anaerobic selenocysteine-containing dehydrogenase
VGRKGEGHFERISWNEAISAIAKRLAPIAAEDPQQILPYSYAGTMGLIQGESMAQRFFHRLGASLLDRTICASAGSAGHEITLGSRIGMDMELADDAKLIVFWGCNAIASSVHFWARAQQAKRRGATLVAIDPYRSLTAEKCHIHIAPLPGTDAALALGVMHVLIRGTPWVSRNCADAPVSTTLRAWLRFAASRPARSNRWHACMEPRGPP